MADPDDREPPDQDEDGFEDDDEYDDDAVAQTEVTIEVTGLSLYTHHGVSAAEREVGQRLVLDLRLEVGDCDATVTDEIDDTVSYATVCERVSYVAQARSLQDARAPVLGHRRPPARRLRGRGGVGEGHEARAADPAGRRERQRRGLAPGRRVSGFLAATAIAPAGDGAFEAQCSTDWSAPNGPNGGYLAAIVLRALAARVGDAAYAPRSLTCHYLRPPGDGPVRVEVVEERRGRTVASLSARPAAGRPALRHRARRLHDRRRGARLGAAAPAAPRPRGRRALARAPGDAADRPAPRAAPLRRGRALLGRRRGDVGRLDAPARRGR
jgi:hypothetical protein